MPWQNMLAQMPVLGGDLIQIDQLKRQNAQDERRNQLADIAMQRGEQQYQQGQQDRLTAEQRAQAQEAYRKAEWALGKPKALIEQSIPEVVQNFERQNGPGSWAQADDNTIQQTIHGAMMRLGPAAGVSPQTEQAAQVRQPASVQEYEYAQSNPGYAEWVKRNQPQQSAPSHGRAPIGFRFTPDGQLEPIPGGPQDPNTKRDALLNKSGAAAAANLPTIVQNAENSLSTLDALQKHPGIAGIFGVRGAIPNIPGSAAADAAAIRDQVLGAAFLEAFNTLKGGGQITEVEGKKATSAITRLQSPTISLREAMTAIQDLKQVIRAGVVKAKKQAALGLPQGAPAGGVVDFNSL